MNVQYTLVRPRPFLARVVKQEDGSLVLAEDEKEGAERDDRIFFKQPRRPAAVRMAEMQAGQTAIGVRSFREAFGKTPIAPNDDTGSFAPVDNDVIENESPVVPGMQPIVLACLLGLGVVLYSRRALPVMRG